MATNEKSTSSKRIRDPSSTPEKKKRLRGEFSAKLEKRVQKYRTEWERNKTFSNWLKSVPNVATKAKCILCNTEFIADISVIKLHAKGKKHISNVKNIGNSSIVDHVGKQNEKKKAEGGFNEKVKAAEIKLCGYIALRNIPLIQLDHLSNVCKSSFTDSNIARNMQLKRTKGRSIICNVIGKCQQEQLINNLNQEKFSVIIDEGTDVAGSKTLAVCVRFFNKQKKCIESKFWNLIQIFHGSNPEAANKGATAERLFEELIKSFKNANVSLANIIGFASDGCNVMFGEQNSVASRMKNIQKGVVVIKCICHSLHLCASEACKMLPKHCEDLARNVYSFFNHSSKRQAEFQEFQEFCNVEPHKLLRPAQTRWLSLLQVVQRILEQWEPLKLFFTRKWAAQKLITAETMMNQLNDDWLMLYYLFLNWILAKIALTNQYFQSDKVVITVVHSKMVGIFIELLSTYMSPEIVKKQDLNTIKPDDDRLFLPLSQLYLGISVQNKLKDQHIQDEPEQITNFLYRCRLFMIELCKQIQKRYDFSNNNIASKLTWCNPPQALSSDPRRPSSIANLIQEVPCIVPRTSIDLIQSIDDQWRKLPFTRFPIEWVDKSVDDFWFKVTESTDMIGDKEFQALGQFVLNLLVLPHSSASCERIFSKVNLIKTDSRNKLITETLNGLVLSSEHINDNGGDDLEPSKQMLESMTTNNLYPYLQRHTNQHEKQQNSANGKENISIQDDGDEEDIFNISC